MEKLGHFLEWGGMKKDILCLIIAAIALCISIFDFIALPFDAPGLPFCFAVYLSF